MNVNDSLLREKPSTKNTKKESNKKEKRGRKHSNSKNLKETRGWRNIGLNKPGKKRRRPSKENLLGLSMSKEWKKSVLTEKRELKLIEGSKRREKPRGRSRSRSRDSNTNREWKRRGSLERSVSRKLAQNKKGKKLKENNN